MLINVYKKILLMLCYVLSPVYLFCTLIICFSGRFFSLGKGERLVWGFDPIINNYYWSKAMQQKGFQSQTMTRDYFSSINSRADWDRIIKEEYKFLPEYLKPFLVFWESLFKYDIFFISFNGFVLGNTPLWFCEAFLLRLAGKKVVVIPYGSDSYVYRLIRSPSQIHGMMMSYPEAARKQKEILQRVDYWCEHGDFIIPSLMGPDGFGRWDVLLPTSLSLDLEQWLPSRRIQQSDGKNIPIHIVHAPNHRGIKGTEFIFQAIEELEREGFKIKLIVLEKMQNSEVREILYKDCDILVDQLVLTGHGLNALEGMASGVPVIANLEDSEFLLPYRRWSYFSENPVVSASPENITDVLRKLIVSPDLRRKLGSAGRKYVEKFQGLESSQFLFGAVIDYLNGRRDSIINLYHPILGDYPYKDLDVGNPLKDNCIIDQVEVS